MTPTRFWNNQHQVTIIVQTFKSKKNQRLIKPKDLNTSIKIDTDYQGYICLRTIYLSFNSVTYLKFWLTLIFIPSMLIVPFEVFAHD